MSSVKLRAIRKMLSFTVTMALIVTVGRKSPTAGKCSVGLNNPGICIGFDTLPIRSLVSSVKHMLGKLALFRSRESLITIMIIRIFAVPYSVLVSPSLNIALMFKVIMLPHTRAMMAIPTKTVMNIPFNRGISSFLFQITIMRESCMT